MSVNSSSTSGEVSDPYIEHLRKKYLEHSDISSAHTALVESDNSVDCHTFTPLPPNPSLTESERLHYNRAMKELGKALTLGEENLRKSVAEFEKSLKSSNEPTTGSEPLSLSGKANSTSANDQAASGKTCPASFPTLPSTITTDGNRMSSRCNEATSMFSSSDEQSLWWDETSTLAGLSRQISNTKTPSMSDVKAIYIELMGIYRKLQEEKRRIVEREILEDKLESNFDSQEKELAIREAFLLEKEKELLERERALALNLENFKGTKDIVAKLEGVELEVQEKIDLMQQSHQLEIERVNAQVFEKNREANRLRKSVHIFKEQNDTLREKFEDMKIEFDKCKIQNGKLKKRLENLQRRQDFRGFKPSQNTENENIRMKKEQVDNPLSISSSKNVEKDPKTFIGILDTLSAVFDWLLELYSEENDSKSKLNEKIISVSKEFVVDKCLKLLPLLVDIIKILPSLLMQKKHLSFLTFVYMCICRVDESQNALLSTTTRRLGEELYKSGSLSRSSKNPSASLILATTAGSAAFDSLENLNQNGDAKPNRSVYFCSKNPEIRMLSSFIILKTLHQVDVLGHVFGQLKKDLKEENNRKIFLRHNAACMILPYITYRANKALMGDAIDVILQMSMESSMLSDFLEQCSNEEWFRAFSSAIRTSAGSHDKGAFTNPAVIEKLSIILQKLSKIKSNRKLFDAFSMGRNLQECYRTCDPKNTFLTLNLRSILFNLNMLKES